MHLTRETTEDTNVTLKDVLNAYQAKLEESSEVSIDEVSKMLQRIMNVNGLVFTKEIVIQYHKMLGFDTTSIESLDENEISSRLR